MKANNIWFHYLRKKKNQSTQIFFTEKRPIFLFPRRIRSKATEDIGCSGCRPAPIYCQHRHGAREGSKLCPSADLSRSCSHYVKGILADFLEPLLRRMMAQWIGRVLQDLCYQNLMFLSLKATGFYSILILSMENLKHVSELQFHLLWFLVVSHHPGNTCNIRAIWRVLTLRIICINWHLSVVYVLCCLLAVLKHL